jgi:hypothetical protein
MKMRTLLCLAALAAPVVVAACGGGQAEPATPANPSASASEAAASASAAPNASASAEPAASAAPSAAASAAPTAPPGPPGPGDWDKWSHEQKMAYMKSDVMPKAGQLFHDFDPKRYAEPKCALCHGAALVADGSFKMPNPELPKLDVTPAGINKLKTAHAKVFEFMAKQVEPGMAKLIGEEPFDPKTKQGFGCLGCHTTKGSAAGGATKKESK